MFNLADPHLLEEGISSKERTLKIMGSPTITSNIDDQEIWIYYAEDVTKILFFKPTVTSRTITAIKFDESGTIEKVTNLSLKDGRKNLEFSKLHTEVKNHKTGFFREIFSNIGQVKPQ
jgi:outer membrane protein assembly factor BamE (lipoprotein component of BamABCDE complex)